MKQIFKAIADRVKGKVPFLSKRSSHWPTVRKHWLKNNTECAACGSHNNLEVHHIKPFHLDRSLELDPANLITLCEESKRKCHLEIGHLGNFRNENPKVREMAWASKLKINSTKG